MDLHIESKATWNRGQHAMSQPLDLQSSSLITINKHQSCLLTGKMNLDNCTRGIDDLHNFVVHFAELGLGI